MTAPKRIQMTRHKPWRADNPDAVIVDRRTKWGNPYRVGHRYSVPTVLGWEDREYTPETAVERFRLWLTTSTFAMADIDELRGRDLACWCPLDQPCHADVLLELANKTEGDPK